MDHVELVAPEDAPQGTEPYVARLTRSSPDQQFSLEASSGSEIGMGADVWAQWRVLEDGRSLFLEPPKFGSLAGLPFYYPWDNSGRHLALPFWGRRPGGAWTSEVRVYDVRAARLRYRLEDAVVPGLSWSPAEDVLLLVGHTHVDVVVDGSRVRYPISPSKTRTFAAWTPSGAWFAIPRATEPSNSVSIEFREPRSGRVGRHEPLDPRDVLPFDEERLVEEARGRLLVHADGGSISSGTEGVTDRWVDARWEPESSLLLATWRPTHELVRLAPVREPKGADWPAPPRRRPRPGRERMPDPLFARLKEPSHEEEGCVLQLAWVRVTIGD